MTVRMSEQAQKTLRLMKRDAFDPRAAAAVREERQFREEQRRQRAKLLLEQIMSAPDGREVVCNILDLTGLNAPVFDPDPAVMSYREGRRSVGLDLQSLVRPDQYMQMLKERYARRNPDCRVDAAGSGSGDGYPAVRTRP